MTKFVRHLKGMSEFGDVIVWAVIAKGCESRVNKMVGTNNLCLLQDDPGIDFRARYGLDRGESILIFDATGCLIDPDLPEGMDLALHTEHLFEALREAE